MTRPCPCRTHPYPCDSCERRLEAIRDDREQGHRDDWREGLDRYENWLDRIGESA